MAKITVEQVNKKVDLLAEKVADLCKALLPSNDKKEGKTKLPELVEGEAAVGHCIALSHGQLGYSCGGLTPSFDSSPIRQDQGRMTALDAVGIVGVVQ